MEKEDLKATTIIWSAIDLDPKRQIRVVSGPFKKRFKVHVREYYRESTEDVEYLPGRGVVVPPENLEQLIEGLILLQTRLEADKGD